MMANTRTITLDDWRRAVGGRVTRANEVNNVIDGCMLELNQPADTVGVNAYPWTKSGESTTGAMWAGVSLIGDSYKDSEGAWMIPDKPSVYPGLSICSRYIRLSPAPPGAEVQYGFCTLYMDRSEEFIDGFLLVDGELPNIRCVGISSGSFASFRMDKMVIAALRVAHGRPGDRASDRFRELLGSTELSAFLVDMLSKCYIDSRSGRNTLTDRSPQYVEMVSIVINEAYPGALRTPGVSPEGLDRFMEAYSLTEVYWAKNYLQPLLLNIVMPEPIFRAVDRNMAMGVPPIVPQYVMPNHHMFNGHCSDPCTGLTISCKTGTSLCGQKILGGIVGTFNTDLYGGTSYWPFEVNPPQEWVDLFVNQLTKLGEAVQTLPVSGRTDLALLHAREIPVIVKTGSGSVLKYRKLVDLGKDEKNCIVKVVTQECDASGKGLSPTNPTTECPAGSPTDGTPDDTDEGDDETDECAVCGREVDPDDVFSCNKCENIICDNCEWDCQACNENFCEACLSDHVGCQLCSFCEETVTSSRVVPCESCKKSGLCPECLDKHGCPGAFSQ